jgi:hypothetical protein
MLFRRLDLNLKREGPTDGSDRQIELIHYPATAWLSIAIRFLLF